MIYYTEIIIAVKDKNISKVKKKKIYNLPSREFAISVRKNTYIRITI